MLKKTLLFWIIFRHLFPIKFPERSQPLEPLRHRLANAGLADYIEPVSTALFGVQAPFFHVYQGYGQ